MLVTRKGREKRLRRLKYSGRGVQGFGEGCGRKTKLIEGWICVVVLFGSLSGFYCDGEGL